MKKGKKKTNYGLDWKRELVEQSDEDYELGGIGPTLTCIAEIPEKERNNYLPRGERQNIGEEKSDCSSRSVNNIIEYKLTFLLRKDKLSLNDVEWLYNNGYIIFD